jgi:cytochrome c biogenesis protein CcmG/thiol:disulfide interchange protein DsbE
MIARTALSLGAVLLLLGGCSSAAVKTEQPDRLPEVELDSLTRSEQPLDLARLRGPAVVNLWATWCTPCRKELPFYASFAREYADRIDVIGVNFQETRPEAARKLARETGVGYPLYADPDGLLRAVGLPKLILVDADGRVAFEKYVEIESVAQLEKLVQQHLGESV